MSCRKCLTAMGVVLLTFADIFAVETHHNANVFANVFNGKGGFNGKFFAMLSGMQADFCSFIETTNFQLR